MKLEFLIALLTVFFYFPMPSSSLCTVEQVNTTVNYVTNGDF